MTNDNNTPKMNGIIADQVSTARKSFMFNFKSFTAKYGDDGNTAKFLKVLDSQVQTNYCEALISDRFRGAQTVAAACRSAVYALEPFEIDLSLEMAELNRVTTFLEMSLSRELVDSKTK